MDVQFIIFTECFYCVISLGFFTPFFRIVYICCPTPSTPSALVAIHLIAQVPSSRSSRLEQLLQLPCKSTGHNFSQAQTISERKMSPKIQTTIAPHTLAPVVTRTYPSESELDALVDGMCAAQKEWAKVDLEERIKIGWRFLVSSEQRVETEWCWS
jgi:hypothetical protein